MNYEAFKVEYTRLFRRMMSYTPDQAGANIFAQSMANLADSYPDFDARLENE